MNRICILALLLGSVAYAQTSSPFTLYVHDTTGTLPDTPLPALYQLASTAVGGSNPTVLKMVNTSSNTVYFVSAYMSSSATTVSANANFSVTGVFEDQLLAPGASVLYTVNFAPTTTGVITGYLNLAYQIEQNGCVLSGSGTVCPGNITNVSTFNGTATAAQLTLSYQNSSGTSVTLTPSSNSPLNFPNTSLSATSAITFTLSNSTAVSITVPAISLAVLNTNEPSAFSIDTSAVPVAIAAGQSANFTVTYAPSQTGLANGEIEIGSNTYPIQGYGIVVADIDSLQISYTNSTGVRTLPQSATPIAFGQVVPGSGASSVLTFNVAKPDYFRQRSDNFRYHRFRNGLLCFRSTRRQLFACPREFHQFHHRLCAHLCRGLYWKSRHWLTNIPAERCQYLFRHSWPEHHNQRNNG